MRPSLVYPNKILTAIIYIVILLCTISLFYGQQNDRIILVILGLPCVFGYINIIKKIYIFLTGKIEIENNKIKVINSDRLTDIKLLNFDEGEIKLEDIKYAYFLEAEVKNILYIKNKIKKYKMVKNETDFSPKILIEKYNIPKSYIKEIMNTKGIIFNENNCSEFIALIEEMKEKYDISIYKINDIERKIKSKSTITYDFIYNTIAEDNLKKADILRIKKYFNENETGILIPLTKTFVNVDDYETFDKNIFEDKKTLDWTLVFSNEDGSNKIYIPHFFEYKFADRAKVLDIIKNKTSANLLFGNQIFNDHNL